MSAHRGVKRHRDDGASEASSVELGSSVGGGSARAAAAAAAAGLSPLTPPRPKQPNQYTKKHELEALAAARRAAKAELGAAGGLAPPSSSSAAGSSVASTPEKRKQPNQYTYRPKSATSSAAGAGATPPPVTSRPSSATKSPAAVQHHPHHHKQPNQHPKREAAATNAAVATPSPRSKQPNQYSKRTPEAAAPALAPRNAAKRAVAATAAPVAAAVQQQQHARPKQSNQHAKRTSGETIAATTSSPAKQPNQHSARAASTRPAATAATAAHTATPVAAVARPRQPNQYAIRTASGDVLHPGRKKGVVAGTENSSTSAAPSSITPSGRAASAAATAPSPSTHHPRAASQRHHQQHQQQQQRQARTQQPPLPDRGVSRDNGLQVGPSSIYSPRTHYTPPLFLRAPMSVILRRTEQILMRDGLSRRQVAEALGLSQSKISRLLHGRSAFRSAAEEFHLRHWLYEQEKRYVSALQSCLAKRVDPKTKLLDFSALPSPLPEVSPPQNIVLYLHYLLPLDERRAVDALVTRALGLRNNDALGGQQQQQQQDDESASDEEEEQTKAPAPSPSPPAPAAAAPPAPLSRAERLALRRAQGELDEDGALPSPSSALVQSALAELSNEQLMHADPDALARARKRAKLEDGSAATTAAGTAAAGSNAAATEASEAALADVCGLDAWSLASGSAVRRRLSSLMSLTHSSQTDLSRLLESSSATVSLLLRGEFRYSTKDKFMKSLQRWGRTTDQMLVTKTLALLGADHDHDHDRDHHPAGGANGVKMMEDNNGAVTDGGGNDDDACMFIKRLSPAGDLSEDLLPADAVRLKDLPQAERQQISLAPPSSALEELVLMLLHAGIPLQTDADEVDADEGATTERTRAPTASPSPPSSPLPHPLSLWSWLRFTCRFSARPQLDTVVLPWVERWSDDGAAHDADDDRLPAFAHEEEDDSPAPVTAVWPLARAQIPAAARFRKYVEEHQQGRMLSVGRLGAHNTDDDQRTPQTSLPPSRSVSDQRSVAEDEQPQMDQNEDSAASGVDEDGHVDDDADSSGTPQQQQQEDDEDGGEGQEAEEEDVMMQPMEADEDEEEQDQDQEHEQAVDADDEQEAMVEYQDDEDAGEPAEEEQQEQEVAEEEAAPLQPDEAELHRRLEADEELDEADDADLVAPNDDAAAAATDGAPATADAIPSQHQQSQQEHLPTPPRTTILAEVAKPIDAAPAASPPAGDDAAGAAQAPEVSAAAAHPFTLT